MSQTDAVATVASRPRPYLLPLPLELHDELLSFAPHQLLTKLVSHHQLKPASYSSAFGLLAAQRLRKIQCVRRLLLQKQFRSAWKWGRVRWSAPAAAGATSPPLIEDLLFIEYITEAEINDWYYVEEQPNMVAIFKHNVVLLKSRPRNKFVMIRDAVDSLSSISFNETSRQLCLWEKDESHWWGAGNWQKMRPYFSVIFRWYFDHVDVVNALQNWQIQSMAR